MSDPQIHRGRLQRLTIFEVTHEELVELERGSPASTKLNIAIALLSTAVSLSATLLTTDVTGKAFVVFTAIVVAGFVVGIVLLMLWWPARGMVSTCIKTIRARLPPPEGIPAEAGHSPTNRPANASAQDENLG